MPLVLDGTNGVSGVDGTASNPAIEGTDSNTGIFYPAADTVAIGTGGTERLRVDSAGNAGLGVTPSAWSGVGAALQVGTSAAIIGNSVNSSSFISNAYFDGTNYRYIGTGFAQRLALTSGAYAFQTAASGTAGNPITFTQAMTLDASGNLLGANTTGMFRLSNSAQSALLPTYAFVNAADVGMYNPASGTLGFVTGQVERARITSGGVFVVNGTAATGFNEVINCAGRFVMSEGTQNVAISSGAILINGSTNNYLNGAYLTVDTSNNLRFISRVSSSDTERARITSDGVFLVAKTTNNSAAGFKADINNTYIAANSNPPLFVNRNTNDGVLVQFRQDDGDEGTISVSGNTVSYNPFLGSHAGAFADWSRPEVKIGTIFETINELIDYKVVAIEVEDVPKRISYNGNGAVGTTATVEYEGQEYTGIIENERGQERDFNKHVKVKINDTPDSKAVYGVFVGWNTDSSNDGGVYNDMLIGAVGNYVIRMAAGQAPEIGDLVKADGTGCAIVQEDDIVRTKTVGKITNTIPQLTYKDGSFLVACVLYCG